MRHTLCDSPDVKQAHAALPAVYYVNPSGWHVELPGQCCRESEGETYKEAMRVTLLVGGASAAAGVPTYSVLSWIPPGIASPTNYASCLSLGQREELVEDIGAASRGSGKVFGPPIMAGCSCARSRRSSLTAAACFLERLLKNAGVTCFYNRRQLFEKRRPRSPRRRSSASTWRRAASSMP